jgi:hypothetical protein
MHPQIWILTTGGSRCVRPDTDGMFVDGFHGSDPRVMYMFDLHVPDSAPTYYDDLGILDHQVKAISAASVGHIDSNEAWVTLSHEKRSSANVTIGYRLRGGLLYGDPPIRPTAAQHADILHKTVLCVHHVVASDPEHDIDPASLSHRCLNPLSLPASCPGSHYCYRRCA